MSDYTPNSHKYREEQKQVEERRAEKVVRGSVRTKKKSGARKFADTFAAEDVSNVKSYLLTDVIVPGAKKLLFELIRDGAEMFIYGSAGRGSSGKSSTGSNVSYRKYYDDRREDRFRSTSSVNTTRFDFDEIVFENRAEAQRVLDEMHYVLKEYGIVRVSDMYDMADLSQPYTSNRFGWTSLNGAEPVRVRDGYVIKLPKAMAID